MLYQRVFPPLFLFQCVHTPLRLPLSLAALSEKHTFSHLVAEVISGNSHPVVTAENLKMLSLSAASCQALPIRREYLRSNEGAVGKQKSQGRENIFTPPIKAC